MQHLDIFVAEREMSNFEILKKSFWGVQVMTLFRQILKMEGHQHDSATFDGNI